MLRGIVAFSMGVLISGPHAGQGTQDIVAGGLILGQAVDATTRKGVPGALVSISGGGRGAGVSLRALATLDGHYVFTGLSPGTYHITATKTGFVTGGHGMRHPNGSVQPILLGEGERVTDASVIMWKRSAISGTIIDEAGEPIVGIQVQAITRGIMFGNSALARSAAGMTDDRGAYRIANLVPGDYIVCAPNTHVSVPLVSSEGYRQSAASFVDMAISGGVPTPGTADAVVVGTTVQCVGRPFTPPPPRSSGPVVAYPTTCFPGELSTDTAGVVSVASGEERPGVDLQIVPLPTVSVSGLITGPEGYVGGLGVRLTPAHDVDSGILGDTAVTVSAANGAFKIDGVHPGDYVLRVERAPRLPVSGNRSSAPVVPAEPTLWAEQPLIVERTDVNGVNLILRQGVRISGRVEFTGTWSNQWRRPDQIARLPIVIEAASRRSTRSVDRVVIGMNGAFTSIGIPAGQYFVRVLGTLPGWTLASVILDGRDVADTPLELGAADISGVVIQFTNRPTELSGTLNGDGGVPDGDATVLVLPTETTMWRNYGQNPRRLRSARAAKNGAYAISGLPAGEYFVAAIKGDVPVDWQEPDYLERIAHSAERVRLAEGGRVTEDLQSREVK